MKIFDWQKPLWQLLLGDLQNLPHAMIMAGAQGMGKLAFAQAFAARLLCQSIGLTENPDQMPCGQCSSCTWLASGNHPDFRLVQPEGEGDEEGEEASKAAPNPVKPGQGLIKVEQIRSLNDFVFIGSHAQGKRIAILSPAESMNAAAANALLKILEEPPAGVYFILIVNSWHHLLPTIRSRCRKIVFHCPDQELAQEWLTQEGVKSAAELLQLVGGAPLLAANWVEQGRLETYGKALEPLADNPDDPVAMAAKWSGLLKTETGFGLPHLVEALQKWLYDLLLLKLTGKLSYHQAWRKKLEVLERRASVVGLLAGYQELLKIRAVARHPLNTQLFLEDLATRYLRLIALEKP
ncbi:MAG: DNA polymerase III subunit delta' [Betaproteobacteria bacterium]|nr:DNA polymerase III subunit delta' [Betaproteobacteria bacterium]